MKAQKMNMHGCMITLLLFALVAIAGSCNKNVLNAEAHNVKLAGEKEKPLTLNSTAQNEAYVYVAGTEATGTIVNDRYCYTAKYWDNGNEVTLTDGNSAAHATAVFAANGKVYTAGVVNSSAASWINDMPQPFIQGSDPRSVANSVVVHGKDIYIAGEEMNAAGKWIAKYWKNGTPVVLGKAWEDSYAKSIFVLADDIYVAGYGQTGKNKRSARYWKNGIQVGLSDGTLETHANSIYVTPSGRLAGIPDVYVAGTEYSREGSKAMCWKNGRLVQLNSNSQSSAAYSVFVKNGDVYVAGSDKNDHYINTARYWKNGIGYDISAEWKHAAATGIFVSEKENVYVCGMELKEPAGSNYVAKYWKNGIGYNLTDGINFSMATSICVKE